MRTPEAQIKLVEKPIAKGPANPKAELIKAKGYGDKVTIVNLKDAGKAKPVLNIGEIGEIKSFAVGPQSDVPTGHNTFCGTTTCCDNNASRPDGSCPPSACTR